jgi:tetratricopeptide (TPR) repeat protein
MKKLLSVLILLAGSVFLFPQAGGASPEGLREIIAGFLAPLSIQRSEAGEGDFAYLAGNYYALSAAYSEAGDAEKALEALKKALYFGYSGFDSLRADPRMEALKKTGFWQKLDAASEPVKNYLRAFSGVINRENTAETKQKIEALLGLEKPAAAFPPELDVLRSVYLMPLGLLRHEAGGYGAAVDAFRRGLAFEAALFTEEAVLIAGDYNYLGRSLLSLQDYGEAAENFNRALDMLEGLNVPPVIVSIIEANLGAALMGKGDFDGALACHRQALNRELGAANFEGLARIFITTYMDTIAEHEKELAFARDRFSPAYEALSRLYYGVGVILSVGGGNEDLCSQLMMQALYFDSAILDKIIGNDDLGFLKNYAWRLSAEENKKLIESALSLHWDMLKNSGSLSAYEKIEPYFKVLTGLEELPPELAFLRYGPLLSWAHTLYAIGEYREPLGNFREVLEFEELFFGGDSLFVAGDNVTVGEALLDFGDVAGAAEHFKKALAVTKNYVEAGASSPEVFYNKLKEIEELLPHLP